MIVSHKYKFIFLKTAKTGGSSIEEGIRIDCGRDDIMTGNRSPIVVDGEKFRTLNVKRGLSKLGIHVPGGIARHFPQIAGFYPHMPGYQVRALVGREIWDSYFKFTIERNPWDRQVSLFFYRHQRRKPKLEFEEHLSSRIYPLLHSARIDNWRTYTIDGEIAVDRILRFERIEEEFASVCRHLGIEGASLPHSNAGPPRDRLNYRDYYTPKSRDIVAKWYRNEIEALGYEF